MNPSSRRRLATFAALLVLLLLGTFAASVLREDGGDERAPTNPASADVEDGDAQTRPRRERVAPESAGAAGTQSESTAYPADSVTSLLVRVTDSATGEPISAARVISRMSEEAVTDGSGTTRLTLPPVALVVVHVRADGYALPRSRAVRLTSGTINEATFELTRARVLRLRVVDDVAKGPVGNAKVDVRRGAGSGVRGAPPVAGGVTEPDGTCVLDNAPTGETVTVFIDANGFAPGKVVLDLAEVTDEHVIELRRAYAITGVVIDAEGEPVRSVTVRVIPADDEELLRESRAAGGIMGTPRWLECRTDTAGIFALRGLLPETRYVAFATRRVGGPGPNHGPFLARDIAEPIELTVPAPGAIVIGLTGAEPSGPVTVTLAREGEPLKSVRTKSAADDRRRVSSLRPGTYRLVVRARGLVAEETHVIVEPGRDSVVDVRLHGGEHVTGVVRDATGQPLAEVQLRVLQEKHGVAIRSDKDGRFRADGLLPRRAAIVSHDGRYQMEAVIVTPSAPDVAVTAVARATFEAVIDLPPGAGEGLSAYIEEFVGEGDPRSSTRLQDWSSQRVTPQKVAGREMSLRLHGRALGPSRLWIESAGWAPIVVHFDAQPGDTVDLDSVTFDEGRDVRLRVVDDAGTPLGGVRVRVNGRIPHSVSTKADGCILRNMADGPALVTGRLRNHADGEVLFDIGPGSAMPTLTLVRHRRLLVYVTGADGELRIDPVPTYVRVDEGWEDDPAPLALTADALAFYADVPPGRYAVAVDGAESVHVDATSPNLEPVYLHLR